MPKKADSRDLDNANVEVDGVPASKLRASRNGYANTKYSPSEFILPGSDHQGHSERVWCRVQPLVLRQLETILKSRNFPYKTVGDIVRHAVDKHVKWLEGVEPMPGFIGRMDMINDTLNDEQYMQQFMSVFQRMEQVIGQHISMGSLGEAQRLVAITKAQVGQIEEPYWREKCEKELKARFGHLLDTNGNESHGKGKKAEKVGLRAKTKGESEELKP